jgi:hypothetical protein
MASDTQSSSSNSSQNQQLYKYAILMETNGEEFESWYNFIRYQGNEDALNHLQKQLEKVDFYVLEDMSTFDLDLDHLVSEDTAREMCMVDLNSFMFHRKFNGKLQKIDFGFSRKDDNEDRIEKVHEILGCGDIDKYVDGEEEFKDDSSDTSSTSSTSSRSSVDSYSSSSSPSPSPSPSPPPPPKKNSKNTYSSKTSKNTKKKD